MRRRGTVEISDGQLVEELRQGSKSAFVALYDRHKLKIYQYCVRMMKDQGEAEDAVQSVFLRLYERANQIDCPDKVCSWLYCVARNFCLTRMRVQATVAAVESESAGSMEDTTLIDEIEERRKGLAPLVRQGIAHLSPELREIIILREFQELTYKEIAEIVSANESTVKFRLFTARRKLSELLYPKLRGTPHHEL
ncbi:MAG: sigma-70 family RNA polymerase sigma factor [Candidatus Zixiibacteriota bacterium]